MPMSHKYVTNTIFLALSGVWAALMLASALIPTYPVLGTSAIITFSSILLAGLTAPLLGPLWGTLAGFVFGWLVSYINPATSMGLLTFLGPTMAVLMSGLVLFDRWKEATMIFAVQMVIWFLHPFVKRGIGDFYCFIDINRVFWGCGFYNGFQIFS